MARIKSADPADASTSGDELPSLHDLLGKPRPALNPTSSNARTRSPAKTTAGLKSSARKVSNLVNPQDSLSICLTKNVAFAEPGQTDCSGASPAKASVRRRSRQKIAASERSGGSRSSSALVGSVDLTGPPLLPKTATQLPAKTAQRRSPSKATNEQTTQKSGTRRQRNLKSTIQDKGLLFQPLHAKPTQSHVSPKRQRRQDAKTKITPSFSSTDGESEQEEDATQDVDIFKGSGIHRKTPRRVAKKKVVYAEHYQLAANGQDDSSIFKDTEPGLSSIQPDVECSETEDESFDPAQCRAVVDDDLLSLQLNSLTLDKPRARTKNGSPAGARKGKITSPKKRSNHLSVQRKLSANEVPASPSSTRSSNAEDGAILRFSPPSSPSPSRLPVRPSTPTTVTPPAASPGKLRSPSKLTSPTKLQTGRTPVPRPSLDAFWAQDLVNDHNDEISPIKPMTSPRKQHLRDFFADRSDDEESSISSNTPSPTASPRKKTIGSRARHDDEAGARKVEKERLKAFATQKDSIARAFLSQLDQRITNGEIGRLTSSTGGVGIVWSKKLNSTAGRANWRRERRIASSQSTLASSASISTKSSDAGKSEETHRHVATIELAAKVVTTNLRLYNVLAHEFCHLANFMLSRELKAPHGPSFQSWARKITAAFGKSHGVEVTTKHDYDIAYKYTWVCENSFCQVEYKRHSKSIDTERHTCGKCRGRLIQILPKPRKAASPTKRSGAANTQASSKGPGEYSRFVKEQWATVKETLPPGSPAKDVMKEVAVKYREQKKCKGEERVEVVEVGLSASDDDENDEVEGVARRLEFLEM